jgi:F-type H+-transporting ATPase subunit b
MRSDCRYASGLLRLARRGLLLCALVSVPAFAAAAQPPQEHAQAVETGERHAEAEGPHEQTTLQTVAKLANFAILAGVLVYFLKSPLTEYLASRAVRIRQDLVQASEMRATATARLAEIQRQLDTLPHEIASLKAQGAADVVAEQARIAQAAAAERDRLIAQTHREIEMRLRVARRELTDHVARLAVQLAEDRIRRTITPADQARMIDRYTAQLGGAR